MLNALHPSPLKSRQAYREYYTERRTETLHDMVQNYQPSAVIFFSVDAEYRACWERIAGHKLVCREAPDCYVAEANNSIFIAAKHPATWGITNAHFRDIGQLIAQHRA